MGDTTARHPITLKRIVRSLEGMERVEVTRNVTYHEDLRLDAYHPSRSQDEAAPAVVIVAGYRDVGVPLTLGCNLREMEFVVSLAQLIAASGMAAIAYSTSAPAGDAGRVVDYIARSGGGLRIDPARLGIWAASGNVPVALGLLMERRPGIRAAVLSNGYTFDGLTAPPSPKRPRPTGSSTRRPARPFATCPPTSRCSSCAAAATRIPD